MSAPDPIYLDHNATTPLLLAILGAPCLEVTNDSKMRAGCLCTRGRDLQSGAATICQGACRWG